MRLAIVLTGALVVAATVSPLHAQDEARLRKALEGKRITLKMDMPATSEGVDVYPGSSRPVDYDKVGKRMKKEGIAWLSSTHKSIEEIATTILRDLRPDRLAY